MHARRRVLLTLLAAVAFARPARSEEPTPPPPATRLPLEAKEVPAPRSTWYGLYLGGAKSGWVEERLTKEGAGEAAIFAWAVSVRIVAKAQGEPVEVEMSERWEFDATPPFAVRVVRRTKAHGNVRQTLTLQREGAAFAATVEAGGDIRRLAAEAPEVTLADVLTPERWLASKPKPGAAIAVREFDLDSLRTDVVTLTLVSRKTTVVDGVETAYYEVKRSSPRKGDLGVRRFDEDGLLLSLEMGGLFEARREPREKAVLLEAGGDLFVLGAAKVEGTIASTFEDIPKVADLVLEARGKGAALLQSAPRQTVERDPATGTTILRIGARHGTPDEASPQEIADGLAETVEYPIKDARVIQMAREAVGDAKTPKEKVARLVTFVAEYLRDEGCPQSVPVVMLLDSKAGDCTEHAQLFTTLARAAGIPAREISGLMYMGDDVRAFGGHKWNEVVLDGHWVPVDATHSEVELDAAHIVLEREGHRQSESATGLLSFKVVSALRTAKPGQPAFEELKDVVEEEPATTPSK